VHLPSSNGCFVFLLGHPPGFGIWCPSPPCDTFCTVPHIMEQPYLINQPYLSLPAASGSTPRLTGAWEACCNSEALRRRGAFSEKQWRRAARHLYMHLSIPAGASRPAPQFIEYLGAERSPPRHSTQRKQGKSKSGSYLLKKQVPQAKPC
jgi:hypothetical protein